MPPTLPLHTYTTPEAEAFLVSLVRKKKIIGLFGCTHKGYSFQVGNMEGHQLVGVKEVKQVPNLEATLEDFHILGADLVHRVNVKNA